MKVNKLKKKFLDMSVEKKLMLSYIVLVVILIALTAAFMLPAQLTQLNEALDDMISQTAAIVARNQTLIDEIEAGSLSDATKSELSSIMSDSDTIDYVVITDASDIRLYHPDPDEIGQHFVGGDETAILEGSDPYITTSTGRQDVQRRAFHAVTNADGETIGFVFVSASLNTVRAAQQRLILKFAGMLAIMLALGILFARLIANTIRRSLLGYEPDAFARMFLQRQEILNSLGEGLIAVDGSMKIHYENPAARQLLTDSFRLKKHPEMDDALRECMKNDQTYSGLSAEAGGRSLLFDVLPLAQDGKKAGALLILHDRTESIRLAEQLTGSGHIVEALRASTHEYLNKLHIISGLLQLGDTEQAVGFINEVTKETQSGYQTVLNQFKNKTVAALLLGKQSESRERAMELSVRSDSLLKESNPWIGTRDLVTIIGNLIENAFDAVEEKEDLREVTLYVRQEEDGLIISVDDTGSGMTDEQIEKVLSGLFTTKGDGHGIGLNLIRDIVQKHSGYLDIQSDFGEGSSFTVSFNGRNSEA